MRFIPGWWIAIDKSSSTHQRLNAYNQPDDTVVKSLKTHLRAMKRRRHHGYSYAQTHYSHEVNNQAT